MGILAMAIGAASHLSLSQSLTEEVNQREMMAANFGENHVRLWQLGVDPTLFLLASPNADNTLMSASASTVTTVPGGEDNGFNALEVDATTVSVDWNPPGKGSTTTLTFPALRLKSDRR